MPGYDTEKETADPKKSQSHGGKGRKDVFAPCEIGKGIGVSPSFWGKSERLGSEGKDRKMGRAMLGGWSMGSAPFFCNVGRSPL